MNPREEIAHLTEVLERANHQYYVLDAPEMDDRGSATEMREGKIKREIKMKRWTSKPVTAAGSVSFLRV